MEHAECNMTCRPYQAWEKRLLELETEMDLAADYSDTQLSAHEDNCKLGIAVEHCPCPRAASWRSAKIERVKVFEAHQPWTDSVPECACEEENLDAQDEHTQGLIHGDM